MKTCIHLKIKAKKYLLRLSPHQLEPTGTGEEEAGWRRLDAGMGCGDRCGFGLQCGLGGERWCRVALPNSFSLSLTPGLLIYFGYGMWNSTLEISAREEALHQSTYQRYDVDVDPFSVDDGFSYATEGESYPDWGPPEDKGFSYQQMAGAKESHRTSSRSKSKGRHKPSSEALIANDELDYSPE